jgi:RNA polymerase sigma-70 factor, ECF subfamily
MTALTLPPATTAVPCDALGLAWLGRLLPRALPRDEVAWDRAVSEPAAAVAETLDARSDERLVALVALGQHDAFRVLGARHLPRVQRIAWRMLGDHGQAEEVAQEALLRVWTHASRFDARRGARFSTWLHRIVLNLCHDRLRRRRHWLGLGAAAEVADPAPHPLARLAAAQESERVGAALAALPARQRTAVVLAYYERLSNAEAAAAMGIGVMALEALLVRARRRLRRILATEEEQ